MHPQLLGGISAYAVMLVVAVVVGIVVGLYSARLTGVNFPRAAFMVVFPIIPTLLGAKLYGLIERGGAYGAFFAELSGGFRYPGAVVGWVTAIAVGHKLRVLPITPGKLADIVAPSFAFSLVVMRIGCILTGCCAGRVCSLPWAIQFPRESQVWHAHVHAGLLSIEAPLSLPVHPLQVYFGMLAFALGCFCLWLQKHKTYDGQVLLVFLTVYGLGQFLLEFLRFGPLPHVQYLSLAIAMAAAGVLVARSVVRYAPVRARA